MIAYAVSFFSPCTVQHSTPIPFFFFIFFLVRETRLQILHLAFTPALSHSRIFFYFSIHWCWWKKKKKAGRFKERSDAWRVPTGWYAACKHPSSLYHHPLYTS